MALQIMKVSMELAFSGTAWHANKSLSEREGEFSDSFIWRTMKHFSVTAYEDGRISSEKHKYQQLGTFVKDSKPVSGEKTASKQPLKMHTHTHTDKNKLTYIHYNVHTHTHTHCLLFCLIQSTLILPSQFSSPTNITCRLWEGGNIQPWHKSRSVSVAQSVKTISET